MCPNDEKLHTKKLIIIISSRFSHFFADIYHLSNPLALYFFIFRVVGSS
ncbi:hypothetical protein SAMN05428961_102649 [Paenibacillus sp. OK060]|nr:hypothetical protein SAMN05428961_102649 [Paenibacillus sp. OK060]